MAEALLAGPRGGRRDGAVSVAVYLVHLPGVEFPIYAVTLKDAQGVYPEVPH